MALFFLITISFGLLLLTCSLFPATTEIAAPRQGFGGAMSNNVKLDQLTIGLDPLQAQPRLYISGECFVSRYRDSPAPAYLMFVFPFLIEKLWAQSSYSSHDLNPLPWEVINDHNASASLIYIELSNDSIISGTAFFEFYLEFGIARTFDASSRGAHTIVLPFETGVGGSHFPDVDKVQRQLQVGFVTPPVVTMDVYVSIPESAVNVQTYPEATSRSPFVRFTDNRTLNSVSWQLSERKTIIVSFVNRQESIVYDSSAIIGSLMVGVALSVVPEWLKETAKKAGKRRHDNDHLSRVTL